MNQFKVEGLMKSSGKDVELTLQADDYISAQKQANEMGIAVSAIHPVTVNASPAISSPMKAKKSGDKNKYRVVGTSLIDKQPVDTIIVASTKDDASVKAEAMHIKADSITWAERNSSAAKPAKKRSNPSKKQLDSPDKSYRLFALIVIIFCAILLIIVFGDLAKELF